MGCETDAEFAEVGVYCAVSEKHSIPAWNINSEINRPWLSRRLVSVKGVPSVKNHEALKRNITWAWIAPDPILILHLTGDTACAISVHYFSAVYILISMY